MRKYDTFTVFVSATDLYNTHDHAVHVYIIEEWAHM